MSQVQIKYHVPVATKDGLETIISQVRPIGPFAINRRPEKDGYNLTHAQTGYSIMQCAPNIQLLKLLAHDLLERFSEPGFWDIPNPAAAKTEKYEPVNTFLRAWVVDHSDGILP